MKELSLNLLDIAQNSVVAGATLITIEVCDLEAEDMVLITISDNGCGMSPEFLERVTDPFTTTRTTRNIGLGLPLLKMEAEMADGTLDIKSEVGKGTTVTATFKRSHIDMPPVGDLTGTMVTLIQGCGDIDYIYRRRTDRGEFELKTSDLREQLDGIPLDEPDVLAWVQSFLEENENLLANE